MLLAGSLAILALAIYVSTMANGPHPGMSAQNIAQVCGELPFLTPAYPLWRLLNGFFSAILPLPISFLLNSTSALCGALLLYVLAFVMYRTIDGLIVTGSGPTDGLHAASVWAGIGSMLSLAFSTPFWIISNRAHPASFHVLLLLFAAWLLLKYVRSERIVWGCLFAFVFCAGIVEFATFIAFAPLAMVFFVLMLWRNGHLRPLPVLGVSACTLLGLSLYLAAAWIFYGTTGYEIREYDGFRQIIWYMWRDQYFLLTRSLPRHGWLLVLFTTVVPWLACLAVAKRGLNEERDWGFYVLHAVMTLAVVVVMLNAPITPWGMLGFSRLLVTPYVLTAMVFGYLVAYWYLLPRAWWQDAEEGVKVWLRNHLGAILITPLLVLACVVPFRNYPEADARPAGVINRYAREVVDSLWNRPCLPDSTAGNGEQWLITGGMLDANLLLAAHEQGKTLRILNVAAGGNETYMKYAASMFEDQEMRNLAQVGMIPMLRSWFEEDAGIAGHAAVRVLPDLWTAAGYLSVPCRTVFFGHDNPEELDWQKVFKEHETFWDGFSPRLKEISGSHGPLKNLADRILRHMSMVANNLGVAMQDNNYADHAWKAYARAREMSPDNLSAALNQYTMVENGYPVPNAEKIKADVEDHVPEIKGRPHIWSLSYRYGQVRSPDFFQALGWTWARSGQTGLALSGLERAAARFQGRAAGGLKHSLANLYLSRKRSKESEDLYLEMLEADPGNVEALLGLVRVAVRKADLERALELLEKAEEQGGSRERIKTQRAFIRFLEGKPDEAEALLSTLVDAGTASADTWLILAQIALDKNDSPALQKAIMELEKTEGGTGYALAVKAQQNLKNNEFESARRKLEQAVRYFGENFWLFEKLLQLDIVLGRKSDALARARQILARDGGNALACYVMGSTAMEEGKTVSAEEWLRKSLRSRRAPGALNDLAWLLKTKKQFEEAEALAEEATQLAPELAEAWDTLGAILAARGKIGAGENAIGRALSLAPESLNAHIHMAELHFLRDNISEAREMLETVEARKDRLSGSSLEEYERVKELIEEGT
ncbi:MAG: tetratricopeptide repeat protein [Kiritimatiellia bacterium]